MKVYMDNLNKVLNTIVNAIVKDDMIFKMLYYVGKSKTIKIPSPTNPTKLINKTYDLESSNIYELPIPYDEITKQPIPKHTLLEKKIHINRRIDSILTESDIGLFINLYNIVPTTAGYQPSKNVKTYVYQIGVICHKDIRKTMNGYRELAIIYRIIQMLEETTARGGIGKLKLENVYPIFDIPTDYIGFSVRICTEGVNGFDEDFK